MLEVPHEGVGDGGKGRDRDFALMYCCLKIFSSKQEWLRSLKKSVEVRCEKSTYQDSTLKK